jgi:cysteinyl-tRNA synthetase
MNITDVGHLVSDADEGEDKMLLASKREKKTSYEIAEYYTEIFFEHCGWLNKQMISLIEKLEEKDIAYLSGGNVYFDVAKFSRYGEFAKLDLESLKSGARIEVDSKKRNPQDFALWFTKSKFENQELQWQSPWGRGYPGWHIECSAMAREYLGDSFDIHCGGIDHIPVHHTNEIAQSEAATGKKMARIWMHGGFLVVDKEKMSKSTGGFLTLDKLKERGIDPLAYRMLCLGGSYRKELSWSWEALEGAAQRLDNLKSKFLSHDFSAWKDLGSDLLNKQLEKLAPSDGFKQIENEFKEAIFNDLGMSQGLAILQKALNDKSLEEVEVLALALKFDTVFGIGIQSWLQTVEIPSNILALAQKRDEARKQKDWGLSDSLRDQLQELGWTVKDSTDGFRLVKNGK